MLSYRTCVKKLEYLICLCMRETVYLCYGYGTTSIYFFIFLYLMLKKGLKLVRGLASLTRLSTTYFPSETKK